MDEALGRPKKDRDRTLVLEEPSDDETAPEGTAASLVLIHPSDAELGRRVELTGSTVMVGREHTCELAIERPAVSRIHAELRRDEGRGGWRVVDLGSTNGTLVNDRAITDAALRDGDQLRFGDVVFKFLTESSIEHQYHDELYQQSVTDALTGVYNRRYFVDALERELALAKRHQHPLTVVLFDLDDFKRINDERGHLAGDAVLKELAARIRPRIRREDMFARYGGEEFAAILTLTPLAGGLRFAEALRGLVSCRPFELADGELIVTMSGGVACTTGDPEVDLSALLRRADEALYEAKRQGRNRVIAGEMVDRDP